MEERGGGGGGWEDDLDVDDSDLPSLLSPPPSAPSNPAAHLSLPPLQPCSQSSRPSRSLPLTHPSQPRPPSPPHPADLDPAAAAPAPTPRRIPGPAGAVQAAMHRRAAVVQGGSGDLRLEGGGDCRRAFGGEEEVMDEDFVQNPWLCALVFLGGDGGPSLAHPIGSIRALGSTERVPKLVAIVKSCKPNGLGDLFVTLKDPTGTIGASIHRRVLVEGNYGGDFSVGCVLILNQVAIFAPMRSRVYLNVTLNNMVKLFGKDCGPPGRQVLPTLASKFPDSVVDGRQAENLSRISTSNSGAGIMSAAFGNSLRASSARQSANSIYNEEVIQNSKHERKMDDRTSEPSRGKLQSSANGTASTTYPGRGMLQPPLRRRNDHIVDEQAGSSSNMAIDHGKSGVMGSLPCTTSCNPVTNSMISNPPDRVVEPKSIISKISVAKWTDEQLSELFCDYQDGWLTVQ